MASAQQVAAIPDGQQALSFQPLSVIVSSGLEDVGAQSGF